MADEQKPDLRPVKALFYSFNLLGDALQTTPALRAFYNELKDVPPEITVATHDNYIATVYERVGVPIKVLRHLEEVKESDYDFVFNFDISRAFKIGMKGDFPACVVFATMLGVEIERYYPFYEPAPLDPKTFWAFSGEENTCIIFQPYSISCSSWTGEPANKRWPDECWRDVYEWLARDYPELQVYVLGGEKDYLIPGIPEERHYFGLPLDVVASLQKKARLVFTLDSGVAHLAVSQDANVLELYPGQCLPQQWMSNIACTSVKIISHRPWELPSDWVYEQLKAYLQEIDERCQQESVTTEQSSSAAPIVAK